MNLPNKLTTIRMIMVLPFLALGFLALAFKGQYTIDPLNLKTLFLLLALVVFVLAMITDWLDGYLARKHKLITTYGKLFDPIADKMMTSSALIILSMAHLVPIWITILIILRDVIVDGARNLLAKNKAEVAASWGGKAKTMLQTLGIILVFFLVPICDIKPGLWNHLHLALALVNIPLYLALILSFYSGFNYIKKASEFINVK